MKVSLIVPTYNRSKYLIKSLPSFLNQNLDKNLYEILIVDNNSTDDTKKVVFELMSNSTCNWKYLFEKKQGLHHARNKGILDSFGEIIVFGDDDIIANESWLENIIKSFNDNNNVGIVGGKIKPLWDKQPPQWIYDYGTRQTHPVFAFLDYGREEKKLDKEHLFGCNFAIKKDLAIKLGGSFPDTFPKKLKHLSGTGESALIEGARRLNFNIIYNPNALVYHCADSTRINVNYFIDRYERWAVEEAFSAFRDLTRLKASKVLIFRAFKKSINAYEIGLRNIFKRNNKRPLNKIKPDYFIVIEKKYAKQMIKQVARVLLSPKLYRHITRKSYLDELK